MNRYLLVVVEGVSEHRGGDGEGVVRRLIREVFTEEISQASEFLEWARLPQPSPRRGLRPSLRGYRAKVEWLAKIADESTVYGGVFLVDNDHQYDDPRQESSTRLRELREGVTDAGLGHRAAIGVAREMVESWLLADPTLLGAPLPMGKCSEELWGAKHDPASNYPKHVFDRCIRSPRGWSLYDAVRAWDFVQAETHSASLREFLTQLRELATSQGCR